LGENRKLKSNPAYKNIFKATSLFGGVQVFQVIINLLRGKIIAVLLGASGMGLNTLFSSTITMVSNLTGLGLNFSAVRDISRSKESGESEHLGRTVSVLRKWLIISATAGVTIIIASSPLLSLYTFKNYNYIWAFVLLSLMLLFNTLSSGNASVLQGTRNLKYYALHSLTGSLAALIVSAPLYFFFGVKGIVPALIITALVTYLFSQYYVSRVKISKVKVGFKEAVREGGGMVKLGVAMMLATTIAAIVNYLINTFISNYGSMSDLGLYQAGMSITSQSIGLVFTAMAIDYYPKLSAVSHDNNEVRKMVNQQGVVTMLIAPPVLLLVILFTPLVIKILLSEQFTTIIGFIRILAFGMFFKAASYSIGAISFAKGDKKVFFLLEGVGMNSANLLFLTVGYTVGGLNGLSYAFLLMHILYFIIINLITRKLYNFKLSYGLIKIILLQLALFVVAFFSLRFLSGELVYIVSGLAGAASLVYSYITLSRLTGIKEYLISKFRRNTPG
jgi:O-antigen/teichoic acid export membrane protein